MSDYFLYAIQYVLSDAYFLPSMALTTMTGIFIGAIIYEGEVEEAKKGLWSVGAYTTLLILATTARVFNNISATSPKHQPLAGIVTIFCVSVFYILGMYLGVKIVKRAQKTRL